MNISEARYRANQKYIKKTYEQITVTVRKGERDKVKEHAAKMGESTNKFVLRAIKQTMESDNQK